MWSGVYGKARRRGWSGSRGLGVDRDREREKEREEQGKEGKRERRGKRNRGRRAVLCVDEKFVVMGLLVCRSVKVYWEAVG